ncbi:MAG TPA: response regulator [Stellaceae bacterium]|nr:response regulator [Stellaceae bacterium]
MMTAHAVLVVDDDDDVRELAAEVFDSLGHEVFQAPNGFAALALLNEHPAISVLFTDLKMPGMSGEDLVAEAMRRFPQLTVLLTSAYTNAAALPNLPFFSKPWRLADLRRSLQDLI